MLAMLITTDATVMELELEDNTQLEQIQQAVNGYIERYQDPTEDRAIHFWVNENGHALKLPLNFTASVLAGHPLYGNVVITSMSPSGIHLRELPKEYWREVAFLKLMMMSGYINDESS